MAHLGVRAGFDWWQLRFLRQKRAVEDLMGLGSVRGFQGPNQVIGLAGFGAEEIFYILYLPSGACDKAPVESVFLLGWVRRLSCNGVHYGTSFILLINYRNGFGLQLGRLGHER